jgi:cell shape-determining protein MreC
MSQLRFQHVFLGLMAMCAISAFALPASVSGRLHPQISMLFAPVAMPSARIAAFFYHRFGGDQPQDSRDLATIAAENRQLKVCVLTLTQQLNELAQRNAEREKLGLVRSLCTPVPVVGADSGTRESLSLRCSTLEGINEGLFVLYPGGVVGQIEQAGVAGAQVRLITDTSSRLRGSFGKFQRRADNQIEFRKLNSPTALVEGAGDGAMVVRGLAMKDVRDAQIEPNDWVILTEPDWPLNLQGQPLGKVVKITARPDFPLFAQIRIEPQENLSRLREVMVVTKDK